jgi:oxygen-independent coproporphyrinogen-3 oxidase
MSRTTIPIAVARPAHDAGARSSTELHFFAPPPLALYIHVPWCVRKCPYCDFNSHEAKNEIPEAEYIAALIADLESALPQIWGRIVSSIFIGGGTPSLFSAAAYDTLLAAVRARVNLQADAEITLEANPGTVEAEKFAGFRAAGINRVSLGIQSFDDAKLQSLGRIHSADEARRAVGIALRHFDRVNLDLMYALPAQTLAQARSDMEEAVGFGSEHLSAYHLTLEPNTPFHHTPPPLPDDDLSADMQLMVEETCAAAGYGHYETSAFAKRGGQCRHNLNYWNFGDYLGIGAGAHGKLTSHLGVVREMRRKHPRDYLDGAKRGEFVQERHDVTAAELPFEFMMNALRLTEGFPSRLFAERTGLPLTTVHAQLLKAQRDGLLEVTPEHIAPTARGQRFLNELLRRFLG